MAAPTRHRVWVGNLAPALPRDVLAQTAAWLGLQVQDFAVFHPPGTGSGVNAAAILEFASPQEAEYGVTLLNGLVNPQLWGAGAWPPLKARLARGDGGGTSGAGRGHAVASGSGFSGWGIRLRQQAVAPTPPSCPPPSPLLRAAKR